jgi:hypothetical protein
VLRTIPQSAAVTAKRVLSVLLSIAVAAEALLVAVAAAGTATEGPSFFGWWPTLGLIASLGVVEVLLVVAAMALWQIGWGRQHGLGTLRRGAIVAVALGHMAFAGLFVALSILWPLPPAGPLTGGHLSMDVAPFLVIALLVLFAFPPGWWPSRVVVISMCALVAAAFAIFGISIERAARAVDREVRSALTTPADAGWMDSICHSEMTSRCAARAARRIGVPVAWVPLPPDWQSGMRVLSDEGGAVEIGDLRHGRELVLINSPIHGPVSGTFIRTVQDGRVRILGSSAGRPRTLTADWRRGRLHYMIRLQAGLGSAAMPRVRDLMRLVRSVRYAGPS